MKFSANVFFLCSEKHGNNMECDLLNMQRDTEFELHAFSEFDVWLDLHFDIEAAFSAIDLTFLKSKPGYIKLDVYT